MTTQQVQFAEAGDTAKRLDQIGWGIFLVMIGIIWLVPDVPKGTWLIGTGILLLILNAIRWQLDIRWSGISVTLGALALFAGLAEFTGITLPLFPIFLVVCGLGLILKPMISQHA